MWRKNRGLCCERSRLPSEAFCVVHPLLDMPEAVDEGWLQRGEFEAGFSKGSQEVKRDKHVFLGYSSEAASVADSVGRFLTEKLGLTVYDWGDFHRERLSGSLLRMPSGSPTVSFSYSWRMTTYPAERLDWELLATMLSMRRAITPERKADSTRW